MKLGYPCKNWSIDCIGDKTFRLKSYSEHRLIDTIQNNLECLKEMLTFNVKHHLLFFRISSDIIPFASHPINTFDWRDYFLDTFEDIGTLISLNNIRISMHPDQFIVLNSPKHDVVQRSIEELRYHADLLDLLQCDSTAKIQLHVGGIYNDKQKSLQRFIERYNDLPNSIRKRLVIENDDTRYSVNNCIHIFKETKIPILLDVFHHSLLNNNESLEKVLMETSRTWHKKDGVLMVDYSEQAPGLRKGSHTKSLTVSKFKKFLELSKPYDFDIMLEIKDKEQSALRALNIVKKDTRFQQFTSE